VGARRGGTVVVAELSTGNRIPVIVAVRSAIRGRAVIVAAGSTGCRGSRNGHRNGDGDKGHHSKSHTLGKRFQPLHSFFLS